MPAHETPPVREAAGGVAVEAAAARCPFDEIVQGFNDVAPSAGFSTLPLTYAGTVRDVIGAAWAEVPDLNVWLAAFAKLPECKRELRETAKVKSFRQLLEGPSWDRARRNIWRVLDGELLDNPNGTAESRARTAQQSDAELYPWRHGNPEGWVEQPQVSIDDEDLWA